jgi:hypothetical protein
MLELADPHFFTACKLRPQLELAPERLDVAVKGGEEDVVTALELQDESVRDLE